jgi:hypothetical protein
MLRESEIRIDFHVRKVLQWNDTAQNEIIH